MATHRVVRAWARRVACVSRSRGMTCNRAQGQLRAVVGYEMRSIMLPGPARILGHIAGNNLEWLEGGHLLAGNACYRLHYFTSGSLVWQRAPRWRGSKRVFRLAWLHPQKVRRPGGEGAGQREARLAARGGGKSRCTGCRTLIGLPVWRWLVGKWTSACLASKGRGARCCSD